jgi:hypothetical protein
MTQEQLSTLYKLYPNVIRTIGDIAYDANGNEVAYNLATVTAKAEADAQAAITAKTTALAKLAALGLTTADLTALGL